TDKLLATTAGGTLDNVTLSGSLDVNISSASVTFKNGLVFNNGTITLTNNGRIAFNGTQTVSTSFVGGPSTGTIIFGDNSGATLSLVNTNWTNTGTLRPATSTLNLGGSFNTADIQNSHLTRSTGTVNLTGTVTNTGSTLTLDDTIGSLNLIAGTIVGGTVST